MSAFLFHGSPTMVDHTPTSAVAAGDVVTVGDEIRIAHRDIAANELGALALGHGNGVYRVPKATGASSAIAAGKKVYWDATNEVVTTADGSGANKVFGRTVGASVDGDAFCFAAHDVSA